MRLHRLLLPVLLLTLPWFTCPASGADDLIWGRKKSEWLAVVKQASKADADERLDRDTEYRVALHAVSRMARTDKSARRQLLGFLGELEQGVSKAEQTESAKLGIGSAMRAEVIDLLVGLGPSMTPDLLEVLAGKKLLSRLGALEALGRGGDASEPVIAALQAAEADETLGSSGNSEALAGLWRRGHDIPNRVEIWRGVLERGDVHETAMSSIAELGSAAKPLLPLLERAAREWAGKPEEWPIRAAMAVVSGHTEPAIQKLIERVSRTPPGDTRRAFNGLEIIGDAAIPAVTRLAMTTTSDDTRGPALRLLAAAGPRGVRALAEVAESRGDCTAWSALLALEQLGPAAEPTLPSLKRRLSRRKHRKSVLNTMAAIGPQTIPAALDVLQQENFTAMSDWALGQAFAIWGEQLIPQPLLALRLVPPEPLVGRRAAHAHRSGSVRHAPPLIQNPLTQQQAGLRSRNSVSMQVHPGISLGTWVEVSQPPSSGESGMSTTCSVLTASPPWSACRAQRGSSRSPCLSLSQRLSP